MRNTSTQFVRQLNATLLQTDALSVDGIVRQVGLVMKPAASLGDGSIPAGR